jgi:predicted dehydrogenase
MARKKIRLGLIGCGGNMRGAHVPRIQDDPGVDLVCAADPSEEQSRLLAEKWGKPVPRYADYRAMLRKNDLDAVFISSPHSVHYEQAKAALERGLHVLCEKPLTISSKHTKALIALAEKKGLLLQVSYQRNYYAPHVRARELVRAGAIGEVQAVVSYVTQNWGRVGGWRLVPDLAGGGMFMDTGSHLVASTLWITGLEPVEVSAFMDRCGKPVDINAVVNVRFRNGALGTLNTFGSASRHDERIAIHGSEGCIVFHLHQWRIKAVLVNDEPMHIPSRVKETSPDAAFFRWIRGSRADYEPPVFALQVARLSEAAYRSVLEKRPVKVAR